MSASFSISNCPVCHCTDFITFKQVPDWLVSKEVFELLQCTSCGFKFTGNAPLEKDISPYYNSEEYVEHSDTKKGIIYGMYHTARKIMLRYKSKKIQKLGIGKKLLDVGSGSGYFMHYMRGQGYATTGIEISEKARILCQEKFNLSAHTPDDFLEKKIDTDFDFITLWHVFEHVYTYNEYFELFYDSLKKDGMLILALPNSDSTDAKMYDQFWAAYDTPRHLWHFTPKTIEAFAAARGFVLKKKYRLPLDPFFNSMVSDSYKKNSTFLPFTLVKALWAFSVSLTNIDKSSSLIYVFCKTDKI